MAPATQIDIAALNRALRALRTPHGNFKDAFKRAQNLFELPDLGMPGSGFMLFGPTGVGKTTLTHAVVDYGHKHYGPDSVMRTQLSNGATMKGVLSGLLRGFGDPRPDYGSEQLLAHRLEQTIRSRKCRLIIIDEVQHLIPGGKPSRRTVDNILNSFKTVDQADVSFLLAGIDDITYLWHADSQLRGRFQTTYYMKPLIYPDDRPTWRGIVKRFVDTITGYGMAVDCPDLDDRLYAACRGALRPLMLILGTAVSNADKEGKTTVTVENLRVAAQTQIDELDGLPNAFDIALEEVNRFSRMAHSSRELAPVTRGLGEILST